MSTLLVNSNCDKEKDESKENLFQLANEFEKLPKQSEPITSSEGPIKGSLNYRKGYFHFILNGVIISSGIFAFRR